MYGVSFIIPAYNEEANIYKCIKSILDEMVTDMVYPIPLEIIVVDNNCTDNTVINAKAAYEDVIIVKETTKGITHARQAGMNKAKYALHAYIDADNYLPKGWSDSLKAFVVKDVVAVSGPLYFPAQSDLLKLGTKLFYKLNILAHELIGPTLQGGNYIVRANAIKQIGHSTHIEFYGEDTDLAVRLSELGRIVLDENMWINSSDRRLREQGIINTTFTYILNYLSVNLINRPVTLKHKDIRPNDDTQEI